jgi:hypothetical protein
MKPALSRTLLALGAVATAALIWFAPTDDGISTPSGERAKRGGKTTAARSTPAKVTAATPGTARVRPGTLDAPERAPLAENVPDLFKSVSWYVPPPPPPPPPPEPPPVPTAPPLPFTYLGQYVDGDTALILLMRGDRLLSVAPGDIIDRVYQVGRLGAGQLTFLYLPLHVEQSLTTGVSR